MKIKLKRILSIIMAVVMLTGAFALAGYAEDKIC